MAERMLKFTTVERTTPPKRAAGERAGDFHEIYADFIDAKAREQASRCSQCGIPFCQTHCPLQNNIPDWLRMTAEGRLEEAYQLSQATNSMPEICGRICPQDRLCEGSCPIEQSGPGPVTIPQRPRPGQVIAQPPVDQASVQAQALPRPDPRHGPDVRHAFTRIALPRHPEIRADTRAKRHTPRAGFRRCCGAASRDLRARQ